MTDSDREDRARARNGADERSGTSRDDVNHPAHYTSHPSGVECIQIAEHFGFNVGNAIKYLWRAGLKSEDPLEDLHKAAWYVQREIERLGKARDLLRAALHP